jgi:hypothetical protein
MANYAKNVLSGSVDGAGILVAATASAGTLIHTGPTLTTSFDEIWLYAVNTSASNVKLTIQWGTTTSPNGDIELTVLPEAGLVTVVPGLVLKGNATPLVVRAFAATANVIVIHGFENAITA